LKEQAGETKLITQDNAKPHILPDDTEFLKAVAGIEVRIKVRINKLVYIFIFLSIKVRINTPSGTLLLATTTLL
jgi:hypothetical protein